MALTSFECVAGISFAGRGSFAWRLVAGICDSIFVMRAVLAHAMSSVALLAFLLIATGCGRDDLISDIEVREKMLYRYDVSSDATIVVTRWGAFVRKWRVTDDTSTMLYQVDTNTQICQQTSAVESPTPNGLWKGDVDYGRAAVSVVDCDALRRDRDMRRYITW
jgi:hypothetical protein